MFFSVQHLEFVPSSGSESAMILIFQKVRNKNYDNFKGISSSPTMSKFMSVIFSRLNGVCEQQAREKQIEFVSVVDSKIKYLLTGDCFIMVPRPKEERFLYFEAFVQASTLENNFHCRTASWTMMYLGDVLILREFYCRTSGQTRSYDQHSPPFAVSSNKKRLFNNPISFQVYHRPRSTVADIADDGVKCHTEQSFWHTAY